MFKRKKLFTKAFNVVTYIAAMLLESDSFRTHTLHSEFPVNFNTFLFSSLLFISRFLFEIEFFFFFRFYGTFETLFCFLTRKYFTGYLNLMSFKN